MSDLSNMSATICILEDDSQRVAAMRACLQDRVSDAHGVFFDRADAITAWLGEHLPSVGLVSLDHDLELISGPGGGLVDPGDGRDAAKFLAQREPWCPVIVHTSNAAGALSMTCTLQAAGWHVVRVVPADDLKWIEQAWLWMVKGLLAERG